MKECNAKLLGKFSCSLPKYHHGRHLVALEWSDHKKVKESEKGE